MMCARCCCCVCVCEKKTIGVRERLKELVELVKVRHREEHKLSKKDDPGVASVAWHVVVSCTVAWNVIQVGGVKVSTVQYSAVQCSAILLQEKAKNKYAVRKVTSLLSFDTSSLLVETRNSILLSSTELCERRIEVNEYRPFLLVLPYFFSIN